MTVKLEQVIDYAREMQAIDVPRERAEVVATELDRLIKGSLGVAERNNIADDPADFLAALWELRDPSGD